MKRAATLYSPLIAIETSNSNHLFLFCQVLNVSDAPLNGTIQLHRADSTSISLVSYNNLAPGVGTGDGISGTPLGTTPQITLVYAKVTVEGHAKDIRANLILANANGNTIVSAEAH